MFVLDTDHIGILQRQRGAEFDTLIANLSKCDPLEIFTSIVSFHEQINGWTKYIKGSSDTSRTVRGYSQLEQILTDFANAQVLPFSSTAAEVFDDLRTRKIRVATMDLRIASIVISSQMTLLTRNAVDFERIPNINIEDWTV